MASLTVEPSWTPGPIRDYALIGDCETAALVGRGGSIDWLCWPRFDSDAVFAALLGRPKNGRWLIAPQADETQIERRYRPDTLILETTFRTPTGAVQLIDFMPLRIRGSNLVRLVVGLEGAVTMQMDLILRFGYGAVVPWVTRTDEGALRAVAGPDMTVLRTPVDLRGRDLTTVASFEAEEGCRIPFVLSHGHSSAEPPPPIDPEEALTTCEGFWTGWSSKSKVTGRYADVMKRSLLTLKALTHGPTGGIVAAPTTSLPEQLGGVRNWDYRYCWIRDATLTLLALMNAGHIEEARAWANWLHRAVAGSPSDMQIMYGVGGERRLSEWRAPWLAGYEGSKPVRVGNAAHMQFQLDCYGELMDALTHARRGELQADGVWAVQQAVIDHVAKVWRRPDQGVWEVRGRRRHFTFSKVMAWVALDRAVSSIRIFGLPGPLREWTALRDRIKADVCEKACNPKTGGFQRAYDDPTVDASLLLLAELGFIDADDPRFAATVAEVERQLMTPDGLVRRYDTERAEDGLPAGEGAFLPCSFWLANAYVMLGRIGDAERLFERLLALSNDLGLYSEEYDPAGGRLLGNFPQAFTHVALLSTAMNLTHHAKPSRQRAAREH